MSPTWPLLIGLLLVLTQEKMAQSHQKSGKHATPEQPNKSHTYKVRHKNKWWGIKTIKNEEGARAWWGTLTKLDTRTNGGKTIKNEEGGEHGGEDYQVKLQSI